MAGTVAPHIEIAKVESPRDAAGRLVRPDVKDKWRATLTNFRAFGFDVPIIGEAEDAEEAARLCSEHLLRVTSERENTDRLLEDSEEEGAQDGEE